MDDADIARHHDAEETFGPKDPKGQCRCLSRMSLLQSSDGNGGALYPLGADFRLRMIEVNSRGFLACSNNQFPRAVDMAREYRARCVNVVIGGFHVSGCRRHAVHRRGRRAYRHAVAGTAAAERLHDSKVWESNKPSHANTLWVSLRSVPLGTGSFTASLCLFYALPLDVGAAFWRRADAQPGVDLAAA
jgi:hypothetical protein